MYYKPTLEEQVKYFHGWVEREENSIKSEMSGTTDPQLINYYNGKLFEIQLVKELMPGRVIYKDKE